MDLVYSSLAVAASFTIVAVVGNWISDWRFKKEMKRLNEENLAKKAKA